MPMTKSRNRRLASTTERIMLGDLPLLSSSAASATACPCVVCSSDSCTPSLTFVWRPGGRPSAACPGPCSATFGSRAAASESRASPTRRPPRDGLRCRGRRATRGPIVPAATPGNAGTHVPLPASAVAGRTEQDAGTQSRRERSPWLSSPAPGLLRSNLTVTRPVVVRPAFGLVDRTLPCRETCTCTWPS